MQLGHRKVVFLIIILHSKEKKQLKFNLDLCSTVLLYVFLIGVTLQSYWLPHIQSVVDHSELTLEYDKDLVSLRHSCLFSLAQA